MTGMHFTIIWEGGVSGGINDKILAIYRSLLKLVMGTLDSLHYSVHFSKYVCLKLSIKKKQRTKKTYRDDKTEGGKDHQ